MDNTLLAGIFGLIGSLIGGYFSYLGSKKAAADNVAAQLKIINEQQNKEKENNEELIRISARIIYIDLLTAFTEMLRLTQEVDKPHIGKAPENFPITNNYSQHIAVLSKKLTYAELISINKLYGLIERLRNDIMNHDIYKENNNRCRNSANHIGVELFGENYFNIAKNADYKQIEDVMFMENLLKCYKDIIIKLQGLL